MMTIQTDKSLAPKEKANVPAVTGTKANKKALSSNLEKPISTISTHKKQILCRLGERYLVRYELASVILDNSGIGGDL
ncbi:hypothetical protein [Parasphingorhabdus sp.]|uniref:hypothetical protein n=1 Tax=Parasphingorhabdus sp. TaxID=2709688 RepID=UPI003A8D9525